MFSKPLPLSTLDITLTGTVFSADDLLGVSDQRTKHFSPFFRISAHVHDLSEI